MEAIPPRPLLTIAIPTWNRSRFLTESLDALAPQLAGLSQVEVRIHDNASSDDTPAVVRSFQSRGVPLDYKRQTSNIGADANFVDCFNSARGRYVWVLSDDDIVLPNALPRLISLLEQDDYALIYVTGFSFHNDALAEASPDPYGRTTHVMRDQRKLARRLNSIVTFISALIANKEVFESIPHEPIEDAIGTNLVQLAWYLPLLAHLKRGLVVYDRIFAARQANSGGYSFATVFGRNFTAVTHRYLPSRPDLARIILRVSVRSWMPEQFYKTMRERGASSVRTPEERRILRSAYSDDWRFWFFVAPVLYLPLPLAGAWVAIGTQLNNLIRLVRSPETLKKRIE